MNIKKPPHSAPYFMALRNYERKLLKETLEQFGHQQHAAAALGISYSYLRLRALHLGGVYPDQPINEPPGSIETIRKRLRERGIAIRKRKKKEQQEHASNGEHPPVGVSGDPDSKGQGDDGGGPAEGADPEPEDRVE